MNGYMDYPSTLKSQITAHLSVLASKKWQDNFSGKYITTNEGNYWWLSIEAGSPIGTEERLHWGRNILPSSFHSFLSSYELGTFTSCFHLHIKFQQNPKVVLWRNTKPNIHTIHHHINHTTLTITGSVLRQQVCTSNFHLARISSR